MSDSAQPASASAAYHRVVLKLSGQALAGPLETGFDLQVVGHIADAVCQLPRLGVQTTIVVGGGNIWRGSVGAAMGMDRATADYMGMLATAINALTLQDALEKRGAATRVQTAIEMRAIAEPYIRRRAIRHLEKGRVVIFACGTGNPYFSTDTAAVLRAAEIEADLILMAKRGVDGVYDADPRTNPDARRFAHLDYLDVVKLGLHVMDATAASLCEESRIPMVVFSLDDPQNIVRAVCGEKIGTWIGHSRPLQRS